MTVLCDYEDNCARSTFSDCIYCDENYKNKKSDQEKVLQLNSLSLWECRQCDDTICRYSVNANLKVLYPDICPLCNRAVNPHPVWNRCVGENDEIFREVIKICNDGIDALDELQIDGYSSEIIIAKRDVIEYLLEKIEELRSGKNDR